MNPVTIGQWQAAPSEANPSPPVYNTVHVLIAGVWWLISMTEAQL